MKLELKHLAPYLPYAQQLISEYDRATTVLLGKHLDEKQFFRMFEVLKYKPILRPIRDLYDQAPYFSVSKLITHGYHNAFWSEEKFSVNHIYYHDLQILLKHHFDVFGLIDAGLAIDIKTITP